MRVGDLIRWADRTYGEWLGIIIRELPGPAEFKMVYWTDTGTGHTTTDTHAAKNLELINASR